MSLASQLKKNKDTILKNLYLGRARWDKLLETVAQAEQEQNVDFKDEQVLTFIVCAAYAVANLPGVASMSKILTNGEVSTDKLWFEVLPFPTRQLEGNTNLDLAIGSIRMRSDTKSGIELKEDKVSSVCFCECKWRSDISLDVSHDIHRNQMARVIENALLFSDMKGRLVDNVYFTLITPGIFKSREQFSRLYQYKWQDYQTNELLKADFDSCSLELRADLPAPGTRTSILKLNWVSYEDLILSASASLLQAEVFSFFQNLALADFSGKRISSKVAE